MNNLLEQWTFSKDKYRCYVRDSHSSLLVLTLHHEKQARLIACAPELLATCKKILNMIESEDAVFGIYTAHIELLKSTIQKAENNE